MPDHFPITEAQIVGLFMETVFYGIYLVTLGLCLRALLFKRDRLVLQPARDINWGMLFVAFLMGVFATLDVAFGLRHNLDAFVWYTGRGGPTAEFADISYWVNVMKSADYVAQTAIGDAILIYRLYMVYEKWWKIVIFPILLWVTTLISGCAILYVEVQLRNGAFLEDGKLDKWIDCLCVFTMVLNIFVTSLIIWKLWSVRARVMSTATSPDRLKRVIRIVLDSGLMYTVCVITFFGTTLGKSNSQYGVSDVVVQVIGITFNLIIIRVNSAQGPGASVLQSTMVPGPRPGGGGYPVSNVSATLPSPAFAKGGGAEVAIDVSHVTDMDTMKTDSDWKQGYSVDEGQV